MDIMNSIWSQFILFFLRSRHTLWRARKQILPLLSLIFSILSSWLNLQTGVATWLLHRFLFVSRVLALQIRQGQTRWKDNTPGYNQYEWTFPRFYSFQVQIPSRNRETNLPFFCKWRMYLQFIFNHSFLISHNHSFLLFMTTRLIYILSRSYVPS